MTPDKIYIFQDEDELWYKPEEWKTRPPGSVEYIRKDALLEWAKEKYNKAYKLHLKKGDNYAYGQGKMDAYQKLIGKLNSL